LAHLGNDISRLDLLPHLDQDPGNVAVEGINRPTLPALGVLKDYGLPIKISPGTEEWGLVIRPGVNDATWPDRDDGRALRVLNINAIVPKIFSAGIGAIGIEITPPGIIVL
jgi:hypothetical protein